MWLLKDIRKTEMVWVQNFETKRDSNLQRTLHEETQIKEKNDSS